MSSLTTAQLTLLRTSPSCTVTRDDITIFILTHGWAAATTRQYAAAVNKYTKFFLTRDIESSMLPVTSKDVYMFILWCASSTNTKISSSTIRRYLTGLRMWHTLHGQPFPSVDIHRVRLLLKSCAKSEVKKVRRIRCGLNLQDILDLTDRLTSDNIVDLVTKAVILVGFWGLARLGELTLHPDHPLIFLRRRDVKFSSDGRHATLRLRLAKTSAPGEAQLIRLRSQPNRLDPINVLHELLLRVPGESLDPLFPGSNLSVPISRSHIVRFLKSNGPQDKNMWSGHSLRIGGASFQSFIGRPLVSLKRLGRWKSSSYKRYVRRYSPELGASTLTLSSLIHF